MLHRTIEGREEIRKLGLKYEPEESVCQRDMTNDISMLLSMGTEGGDKHQEIEDVTDDIFLQRIVKGLKSNKKLKGVHKISWDRIFFFPNMNTQLFEAKYWLRVWAR